MKDEVKFTTEDHWKYFSEFCKYEIASGGPDPQIKLVGEMSRAQDFAELVWRGGCYICVYNVPFAEILWQHWPWSRVLDRQDYLLPWIEKHWDGIKTRVERKSVRIKANMAKFLIDYANWIISENFDNIFGENHFPPYELYNYAFKSSCDNVKFLGRYVALKLMEYYKQYCALDIMTPDIRPAGAWSPRKTLSVLMPKYKDALLSDDRPETLGKVDYVVDMAIEKLNKYLGYDIDIFQFQVMLCEYRESYEGMRQYPGRSHDSELGYWHKAEKYWGKTYTDYSNMLETRKRIFPSQHLGELNGWDGARNDIGVVLAKYNYTWSDLKFSYTNSKDDLEHPVSYENLRNRTRKTVSE